MSIRFSEITNEVESVNYLQFHFSPILKSVSPKIIKKRFNVFADMNSVG